MMKGNVNLGLLFVLIEILSFSCKSSDNKINSNTDFIAIAQNKRSETYANNQQDTIDTYSNLQKVDLDNIPPELLNFPLSWERFGIDKGDTVTYSFCNASNPEFTINYDYKSIEVIIGNELHQTFKISSIYYNDSIFKLILEPNNAGLNYCAFKWIDKNRLIGTLLLYGNESSFEYLPKNKLKDKLVIEEECDETDI